MDKQAARFIDGDESGIEIEDIEHDTRYGI
jgi:hypothetical protein